MADIEKLKQIKQLVDECIAEYQGEDEDEGDESSDEDMDDSAGSPSPMMDGGAGGKIAMAASLMRKKNV